MAQPLLADLRLRIRHRELTAYGKLMQGIVDKCGKSNALAVDAREFNLAAEQFYRCELKQTHLREALGFVRESLKSQTRVRIASINWVLGEINPMHVLNEVENSLLEDKLKPAQLRALINLILSIIHWNSHESSIHRSAYAASL